MPLHFGIVKKFIKKPKIIVPVRDLKEILSSFIRYSYESSDNYIAFNAKTLQERCDFIMLEDGMNKCIECVYNLSKPENRKYCYFMEYNELVNNTKKTISEVYDFLGITPFEHHYTKLSQLENNGIKYNDSHLGGELHKVKEDKISKSDYNIWDYLPKDIDKQYNLAPFWR
jgi:hypothetical protein